MHGITEEEKVFKNHEALVTWVSDTIHREMGGNSPSWDEALDKHLLWSNNNPQLKGAEGLQNRGAYEEYTLSLSICQRSVLQNRIGYVVTSATVKPWLVVKKSSLPGAGLGVFAAKTFNPNEIICVYFAPEKSKQCTEDGKYTIDWGDWYYNVPKMTNKELPYYMGAHFINDATFNCGQKNEKRLEHQNNSYLEGLHVKAKGRIDPGREIKFSYKGLYDYKT